MTPAEKRQIARAYARMIADRLHPSPTEDQEVEIADHFLKGMNFGIRRIIAEARRAIKNRKPATVLTIVRKK